MVIPALNKDGFLPFGIHPCTVEELEAGFGQNQWIQDASSESRRETLSRQRSELCERLKAYLVELSAVLPNAEVLVDGSFVTSKPDPNDIDLIVVLPAGYDLTRDPRTAVEHLLTKEGLKYKRYPFDLRVVTPGSDAYTKAVAFFSQVRNRPGTTKGLLKVVKP